jgi:hypothetical protein
MTAPRIICIAAVLVISLAAVHGFSQEDMMFVANTDFDHPVRTPAVFEHDVHNETAELEDCNVCHHLYIDGELAEDESSEDQACSECHDVSGSGDNPSLRRAFHLNCKGCHLEKGAGPIMCAECHPKAT